MRFYLDYSSRNRSMRIKDDYKFLNFTTFQQFEGNIKEKALMVDQTLLLKAKPSSKALFLF